MTAQKKYPIPTPEQEDIEEALGVIWSQFEAGVSDRNKILPILEGSVSKEIFSLLQERRFVEESGGKVILTAKGDKLARDITRRHRLAERLLSDVLALSDNAVDPNACKLEHIISPEVAESICALLGHPRQCPHGQAIPKGDCCDKATETVEPIILSLDRLESGAKARIAYLLLHNHPDLHRLLSFGLVPGTALSLHQTFPSYVLEVGETTLALEKGVAEKIFVRRIE